MLYIAVVDDEQTHRDILVRYIEEWKRDTHREIKVESYDSGEAFYFAWCEEQRCDVLFLDIMMKETDGISLARKLREKGKDIVIIFTTGIVDYMQEGYEVEAMHYLLKPLNREKVRECLEKCVRRKETAKSGVLLPTEGGLVKINVEQVLYAEAVGHYSMLVCLEESMQVRMGIRELEEKLRAYGDFAFCHRSYLVNIRRISRLGRQEIIMDNGATVPVSRRLYHAVNEKFIQVFVTL